MISPKMLLSTTWEAMVRHRRTYGVYVLLLTVPIIFFEVIQMLTLDVDSTTATALLTIKNIIIGTITYIVTTVITLWVTIAVIYSSYTILQHGKTPDITTDLKTAIRFIVPIFVLSVLVSLIVTGGFLLLIIPGIIFAIWTMFAYHVYLLEHTKIIESIKRSTALVRGRFWPIFGRLALLTIVVGLVTLTVLLLPTFLFALASLDILIIVFSTFVSATSVLFILVALTILYLSCNTQYTFATDRSPNNVELATRN